MTPNKRAHLLRQTREQTFINSQDKSHDRDDSKCEVIAVSGKTTTQGNLATGIVPALPTSGLGAFLNIAMLVSRVSFLTLH